MECLSDRSLLWLVRKTHKQEEQEKRTRLVKHLRQCTKCRDALAELQQSLDKLEEEIRYDGVLSS